MRGWGPLCNLIVQMSEPETLSIAVVGGGSWGTAIAKHLAEKGYEVVIWVREAEVEESIASSGENALYLPGIALPPTVAPTRDLELAVSGRDLVVFSVPAQYVRSVLCACRRVLPSRAVVVNTAKGIELSTGETMSQLFSDLLGAEAMGRYVVLSGPSFALEVAQRKPAAVSVASSDEESARLAQRVFSNRYFRAYVSDDVTGVEIGGAMKNVIAIAAGIVEGLDLGDNAKAALITRGLAEITRLGVAMGARPATFAGLSGMGDLVLTCTGSLSRNKGVGRRIGEGETLEQVVKGMNMVAEGVKTSRAAVDLARRLGVELPITEKVVEVLYDSKPPQEAIYELMTRELKREVD